MRQDAAELFESLGLGDFGYREILESEQTSAASSVFSVRELAPAAQPRRVSAQRPWCVAFVSPVSDVGRTSLVANVADAIARAGQRTLAIDLDPADQLGRLFGVPSRFVFAAASLVELHHQLGSLRASASAVCLPFGTPPRDVLARVNDAIETDSAWLDAKLSVFAAAGSCVAVCDTTATATPFLRAALRSADELVVVIRPADTLASTLQSTESFFDANGLRGRAVYLLNGFDARRAVDREQRAALRGVLGGRLLPFAIQEDRGFSDAMAQGALLIRAAPSSQAVADIDALGAWLVRRRTSDAR
jgi:cellulose synthase operon protein YhjQ